MYITYEDYLRLGYKTAPELEFERYNVMAEAMVRKRTQNRIQSMTPPADATDEDGRVCDRNQRGMCEIIDIYYTAYNPQSDAARAKQVVTAYSNGKYSESYMGSYAAAAQIVAPERLDISAILAVYFTPDQVFRGVG